MKKSKFSFIKDQLAKTPPIQPVDLSGQTVCVVGANIGLGFEAAKHFARMRPAKLILGCRSLEKGNAALKELEEETSFDRAEVRIIDLSQFSSVKAFAEKFEREEARLDILLMNAAVASFAYTPTPDGWEPMLQVNHLSTALTSLLLFPLMQKTAREHSVTPRLVVVSSEVHYWADKEAAYTTKQESFLKVLSSKEYCTPKVMRNRYGLSKLFNVLFVKELQSRLTSSSPIIVNAVNPGFCLSALRREATGLIALLAFLMEKALARTTEEGSRQLVWASVHGDSAQVNGAYITNMRVEEASDFVFEKEGRDLQTRLWNETIDILKQAEPRVEKLVEQL